MVRVVPIKTLFSNPGVNHAHSVTEEVWPVCDIAGTPCSHAPSRHFLFSSALRKLRIFEPENERCWSRIRRGTLFRVDRQPESGFFLSRFRRSRLNLTADISTGNLDADLVRNLDCQG